jgi:hypothetical protein
MTPQQIIKAARRLNDNDFARRAGRAAKRALTSSDPQESREQAERAVHLIILAQHAKPIGSH